MSDLERRLRRIVLVAGLLGIAAMIAGMFPGEQTFGDANNCSGGLFAVQRTDCTPSYTNLLATRPAGGMPLALFVVATLVYGAFLRAAPGRWFAVGWTAWTGAALIAWFVATFDLFSPHTVSLPAGTVTYTLLGAMLLLIFPVTPIVAFASKRTPRDDAAEARVVMR